LIPVNEAQTRNRQFVFREVNARIAEITITQGEPTSGFICECGQSDCTSILDLSLGDYQALREGGDFFIAARGHCVEGVDRLVESREGFDVLAQV
jgi:hypothetical protein